MKKTILAWAVMLVTGLPGAFAKDGGGISQRAIEAFNRDFTRASDVSWQKQPHFIKATFSLDSHIMSAYYDQAGDLIAVVRNILSDQLPILLFTQMKKYYNDHWVSELFEVSAGDQSIYYVSFENSEEKLILESDGFIHWSVYKRKKKDGAAL